MKQRYLQWALPFVFLITTAAILSSTGRAGRTGSPGESTCVSCHNDFALNSGGGSVTIRNTGMNNWTYVPGTTYTISVKVAKAGATLFGVGVECLTAANGNAGTLVITNPGSTKLLNATVSGVSRINVVHTQNGGLANDSNVFVFNWTAPAAGTGNVTFYFAGNAANNDQSNNGDYIYTGSQVVTECSTIGTPGTITGQSARNCGVSTKTYSIPAVAGATSYSWRTDIVGALLNGVAGPVVTTTPSVNLTFPANFVNAKIYVKAQNACNVSAEKSKTLSSKPSVPAAITGITNPCTSTNNVSYTIAPVTGATSYSWTIPSNGMTLASGQGTTNLFVNTKAAAVVCTLKVGSVNACGTSTKKSLVVNLISCARNYELLENGLSFSTQPEMIEIYGIDGRLVKVIRQPAESTFTPDIPTGLYIFSMRFADGTVENQKVLIR